MLSFLLICLLMGAIGALLQGAIGIGTGIVIVPLLSFMLPDYGISQDQAAHIALTTSLAAIAINSISALISHQRHHNIQWPLFKKMILFSIIGSGLGAFSASLVAGYYLETLYGLFLLLTSALMLHQRSSHPQIETMPQISIPALATGGFSIGFIGSIVGSGGGILMVPYLHQFNLNIRYAVGTATMIGFPVSIMGALTYSVIGASKISMPYIIGFLHWPALIAFSLAGLVCAPFGVKLAARLPTGIVRKLFVGCIILIGLKMLIP